MKSIKSSDNTNWQNDLLKDLEYIKAHKRYKMSSKTISPTALIGLILLAAARVALPLLFVTTAGNPSREKSIFEWIMTGSIALFIIILIVRALKVLKFDEISTSFHLQENIALLKKFLTSNHLAFTQHAEAPEVFMIISRNLDANANNDYREVMVFIAGDKQILINSHFTGRKYSITPPSRNYKRMAKELRLWMDKHIGNNNNTTLPVQSF